jgi:hypothetical protein
MQTELSAPSETPAKPEIQPHAHAPPEIPVPQPPKPEITPQPLQPEMPGTLVFKCSSRMAG